MVTLMSISTSIRATIWLIFRLLENAANKLCHGRFRHVAAVALLAPLLTLTPSAQAGDDIARIDKILDKSVSRHEFMGAVLVARDGKILLNKGYGYANLEWNVKNTAASKFRLGSISKQFTAAAILLLEERGKLKVGDPIGKFLPDAPAAWSKVTLFHLLSHTSGVPSYTDLPEIETWGRLETTPMELIGRLRSLPLEFEPGERWSYSNSGYFLLGYVIEQVSGQSYAEFLHDNIFTPLHMHDTGYDHTEQVLSQRASGYRSTSDGITNAEFTDMSVPFAAGALYSTTGDLFRWETALFGEHLLSASSLKKMTTPSKGNYGFGIFVHHLLGRTDFEHGGNINGFSANMEYFPDDGLHVILLSNVEGGVVFELAARIDAIELDAVKHGSRGK